MRPHAWREVFHKQCQNLGIVTRQGKPPVERSGQNAFLPSLPCVWLRFNWPKSSLPCVWLRFNWPKSSLGFVQK
jgi:hypothetical protein